MSGLGDRWQTWTCRDSRRVTDQTDNLTDRLRGWPETDRRYLWSRRGGIPGHTMSSAWSAWSQKIDEDLIVDGDAQSSVSMHDHVSLSYQHLVLSTSKLIYNNQLLEDVAGGVWLPDRRSLHRWLLSLWWPESAREIGPERYVIAVAASDWPPISLDGDLIITMLRNI